MSSNVRIRPRLKYFLQCDDVRMENGKYSAVGVFDAIYAVIFPANHPRFFLMLGFSGGIGEFDLQIQLLAPDGSDLGFHEQRIEFTGPDQLVHSVFGFENFALPMRGSYKISVFLDGDFFSEQTFAVRPPTDVREMTDDQRRELAQRGDVLDAARADINCPNCGEQFRFQTVLDPKRPLDPGHLALPENDQFRCDKCGEIITVADVRENLTNLLGAPLQFLEQTRRPMLPPAPPQNASPEGDDAASRNSQLFARAQIIFPGGVNSPVRAWKSVGGEPIFVERALGSRIFGVDGTEYLDYVASYGPHLFGHAPAFVRSAVAQAMEGGTSFGTPTPSEIVLGELVRHLVPSVEMLRFVNSGGEAVMSAVRLARGFTGRTLIVKCAGCYHGSIDSLLVAGGSGMATLGIPSSLGVPDAAATTTLVVPFNDTAALQEVFDQYGDKIAAFLVEPICGNMGVVPGDFAYLAAARDLTRKHGALLVFDEVMTGFRVAPGGAQQLVGIVPDITCLGKILGGGLPGAAYGGRRDIMQTVAPMGDVYQAGTLSGNPIVMAAGIAMLRTIVDQGGRLYSYLDQVGAQLQAGLAESLAETATLGCVQRVGSMLTIFFRQAQVRNFDDAKRCDTDLFAKFFHGMIRRRVHLPPSQFEAWFVSAAHTQADIQQTIAAAKESLAEAVGAR